MRRILLACPYAALLLLSISGLLASNAVAQTPDPDQESLLVPMVEGEWWRIADDDPDVSPFRIVSEDRITWPVTAVDCGWPSSSGLR
jgi:hypothetical protein